MMPHKYLAAVGMCILLARPSLGQTTLAIRDPANCATCELLLNEFLTIRRSSGVEITVNAQARFAESGKLVVLSDARGGQLAVLDSLGRTIRVTNIVSGHPNSSITFFADTIVVADAGRHRLMYWLNGRTIRQRPIPQGEKFLPLRSGHLVIAALYTSPERAGLPLHIAQPTGAFQSFGNVDHAPMTRATMDGLHRAIADAKVGGFWVAYSQRYRLELWSTDARLIRVLEGHRPWFDKHLPRESPLAPWPWVAGLDLVNDSLALVLTWIPDADSPTHGGSITIDSWHRYTDSVIELVNVRTGMVLGTARSKYHIAGFAGRSTVYTVIQPPNDDPEMILMRVTLPAERR